MFQPVGVAPVLRRCCGGRRPSGCRLSPVVSSAACTCADCCVVLRRVLWPWRGMAHAACCMHLSVGMHARVICE